MKIDAPMTVLKGFPGLCGMDEPAVAMVNQRCALPGGLRCILLAGGLKPTPLGAGAGMPALRLFPDGKQSLINNWIERVSALGVWQSDPEASIEMRVVFDRSRDALEAPTERGGVNLVFESESGAYRGPAGVAHDVAERFPHDVTVLIAEANRWLDVDLAPMVQEHAERGADVTVARLADGAPAGVYLARWQALHNVAPKGFVDLKEQWLATLINEGMDVFVHTLAGQGSVPIRTREDLLTLAYGFATNTSTGVAMDPPIVSGVGVSAQERWSVISDRANVHESAVVIGSVVMPGAVVRENAVVARSVVPPGAVVEANSEVVDDIVRGDAMVATTMSATVWERTP